MADKKFGKEVTRKEDGRTLIYYTREAESPGEDQAGTKTGGQADGSTVEK